MPINDISYKRNDEYISLIYKNNPSKCICKLYLNEPQNYVLIPTDGVIEERIDISNIYELAKKKKYFIQSLKRYLNPLFNFRPGPVRSFTILTGFKFILLFSVPTANEIRTHKY